MSKHWRLRVAKLAIPLAVLPLGIWANRGGPPTQVTGAPGEDTCFAGGCHNAPGGEFFADSEGILINFPGGGNYTPGVQQRLRLTVTDAQGQVFGFSLSVRDQGNGQAGELDPSDGTTNVRTAAGIQYISHSLQGPRADGTFEFDWTPPASDVGPVTFYVAANAANNNRSNSGDRIHTRTFELQPGAAGEPPTISDGGIVHGATFTTEQGFSPNTFGTIVGTNLVQSTQVWDEAFEDNVAPIELGGVRVLVNNQPAFISFTGTAADLQRETDQINFLFPDDEDRGPVNVQVETADGLSNMMVIDLSDRAPAFFTWTHPQGATHVVAAQNDFSAFVGPEDLFGGAPVALPVEPANPGDAVRLFGTGFGATDPPVPTGEIPTVASQLTEQVRVFFGQTEATVVFAGLSEFAGVYQIIVETPSVSEGNHELTAEIGGQRTQLGVFVAVADAPPA